MKKYLLDSNICIYFLKGKYDLNKKISNVGAQNCFISEITVAELKFGVENSNSIDHMRNVVEAFIPKFTIVPIFNALDVYATEKARLRKSGMMVDDFDLLLGATAIANKMIMVTHNVAHFKRLEGIEIEDWAE